MDAISAKLAIAARTHGMCLAIITTAAGVTTTAFRNTVSTMTVTANTADNKAVFAAIFAEISTAKCAIECFLAISKTHIFSVKAVTMRANDVVAPFTFFGLQRILPRFLLQWSQILAVANQSFLLARIHPFFMVNLWPDRRKYCGTRCL